jgi:sterol desaturase/sphingolipid hydroxylase (fatty acid hydroxylase superfamily)
MPYSWAFIIDTAQRFWLETPARLWVGCFVVGIVIELAFGDRNCRPGFRVYATNISHGFVYLSAIFLFSPAVWYAIAALRDATGIHGLINLQIVDNSTYLNQAVLSVIYLFLIDFFQYWWHRGQHSIPFLWDQHVVHHSDEKVNATTAVRHHWTEFMFQAFVVSLPLSLLFKITPNWAGAVGLAVGSLQFYLHSNLKIHCGRFSWLIGTPGTHRIHHSILAQHQNRNFAAYFPIWDVIFGTYYCPAGEEFPPSGVAGVKLNTVTALSAHTFIMWFRRAHGFAAHTVGWLRG